MKLLFSFTALFFAGIFGQMFHPSLAVAQSKDEILSYLSAGINVENKESSNKTTQQHLRRSVFKNVLIIGNSITKHGLAPFWWGNWGMAASTPEKDFVHILVSLLREQNPSMNFSVLQASGWEKNHRNFSLDKYDSAFSSKPDLVILRLGENVRDLDGYEKSYLGLLNYIKEKTPHAKIVATGCFWTDAAKDLAMSNAAKSAGALFIPLSELDVKENKSSIGAVVTGEDGLEHKIDHDGVAKHPGDEGMKQIAHKIFNMLP